MLKTYYRFEGVRAKDTQGNLQLRVELVPKECEMTVFRHSEVLALGFHATVDDARAAFRKKQERMVKIARTQLERAETLLSMVP